MTQQQQHYDALLSINLLKTSVKSAVNSACENFAATSGATVILVGSGARVRSAIDKSSPFEIDPWLKTDKEAISVSRFEGETLAFNNLKNCGAVIDDVEEVIVEEEEEEEEEEDDDDDGGAIDDRCSLAAGIMS